MFRRKDAMEIHQLLMHVRETASDRRVHRNTGVARPTVKKFRAWAKEHGLLEGALPPVEALHALLDATMPVIVPPQNQSTLEPYRDLILELAGQAVPMTAIRQQIRQRGGDGSYWAIRRFIKANRPVEPDATVRVETLPGEEAQVDFGYAGLMQDEETGVMRKAWVFVMTLSWSRHQYLEFVFDQRVETWLRLHANAFAWFGGVPRRLKIDNLKAAIVKAAVDDPVVQRAYRECAEHFGFLISPCRPRTPEHKGKVEAGVKYVKGNLLAGRTPTSISRANRDARVWAIETAGQRIHGTMRERPLARFAIEKAALQSLPPAVYDLAVWKRLLLHRDCHVVMGEAFYSAPFRLVGQHLWVRRGLQAVRIFTEGHELVATHDRATRPGERKTNPDHLPPHKVPGLDLTAERCRERAGKCGTATATIIGDLLDDPVIDRLRTAGKLLRLAEKHSPLRLETACRRALDHGDPSYDTIKRILRKGLEVAPTSVHLAAPPAAEFVRQGSDLLGRWQEAESWN